MAKVKTPQEMDDQKFLEIYNDASISNADACKTLGTDWRNLYLKANKPKIKPLITVRREGGLEGTATPMVTAKKSSVKKTETKSTKAAEVANEAAPSGERSGTIAVNLYLRKGINYATEPQVAVTFSSEKELQDKIAELFAKFPEGMTPAIYRGAQKISRTEELRDGDNVDMKEKTSGAV